MNTAVKVFIGFAKYFANAVLGIGSGAVVAVFTTTVTHPIVVAGAGIIAIIVSAMILAVADQLEKENNNHPPDL